MNNNKGIQLMEKARIERSLKRIALEILEDAAGSHHVVIGGIKKRGSIIAGTLQNHIQQVENCRVPLLEIDLEQKGVTPEQDWEDQTYFVLVDDVIFSGRTMFKALEIVTQIKMAHTITGAVLIDRGHRKLPVTPTYTGLHIPTKFNEHISVKFKDNQAHQVILTSN